MKKPAIVLTLICLALTAQMRAATINVPADFISLQAALAAAATGDEIVISTNGPFNEFIALYGSMASNITVRAATGFNPVIEGKAGMTFSPAGTPPDAAIQDGVLVFMEHGSTWIGIKFRINMAGLDDLFGSAGEKYHCKIAGTSGGSVNFTNCIWEWANDPNDPNALNSHMLRVEAGAALNTINFDHCQWKYTSMTPTNLGGRLTGAFTDSVGVVNDTTFTDCSWDISPDTGGFRRHGVGVLNSTPSTLRFLRCNFGDVDATDPTAATEPRQGQAWVNLPHRITYMDQCKFGRGAGRVIATAIPGEMYINRCLFRPTRGNFTLNDPVFGGNTIPTYFTNCVFQYRTTATGSTPINDFNGAGTDNGSPGRGSFIFAHCTYVDLDGAAGATNRGFMSVGDATEGSILIENCLFSAPAMAIVGIIKNVAFTPAGGTNQAPCPGCNIIATITVNGTNMLQASSGYNITNDVLQNATGNNIPVLANPLLQADGIHLSAGSPAIDAGGTLSVLVDYDGYPRPKGLRPDIGADESSIINVPADYTSLQAAIAAAGSGDEIVVSTNGPFHEFISLHGSLASNITVRAATGYSPVIEFTNGMDWTAGTPPANPFVAGALFYTEHGSTWIGLKFRVDLTGLADIVTGNGDKYHSRVGVITGGSVNFTNCTWEWANDPPDPNVLNSQVVRVREGTPGDPNTVNFDHCHWGYVNITPTNLSGRLDNAFKDTVRVGRDTTFTDCSWDISPDTSGQRRHAVGSLNTDTNTLRFLRCNFGDVTSNDPAGDVHQGQAWCNIAHRTIYFDQCQFGRGAGRVIATANTGKMYVNRCLFRPTRGNHVLNDPGPGTGVSSYFTNCVFFNRSTAGTSINDGTAVGASGGGNYIFSHCTYVELDTTPANNFITTRDTALGSKEIDNCLFSMPTLGAGTGIIRNADTVGGDSAGGVVVNGTNMLLASSSYNPADDTIHYAAVPRLADPLLAPDNIHLLTGSPAIDGGSNLGVLVDYDGNPRPIGPRPDIGATEGAVVAAVLTITQSGANVVISWTGGGMLQAAPEVTGTYTNITGATTPYTNAITSARKFFRTAQ